LRSILELFLGAQNVVRDFHTHIKVLDPSVGEFEKDSAKIQCKLSAFLNITASHDHDEIIELREQFMTYEGQLMAKLIESRLMRKRVPKSASPTPPEPVRHTGSSSLRLELPEFSGHPLDWHHFSELFTIALERAGHGFSDREKSCFLLKDKRNSEAEQIVKSYSTSDDGYNQALRALTLRYGAA